MARSPSFSGLSSLNLLLLTLSGGLPLGVQAVGRLHNEARLLRAVRWHRERRRTGAVTTQVERLAALVGLMLLVAFFAPYVFKLPQLDITLILLGGLVLATFDFWKSR